MHGLQVDEPPEVWKQSSPELVEEVKLDHIFNQSFLVSLMVCHGHGDVAVGIRNWILRSQCVSLIGIKDDGVDLVKQPKKSQMFSVGRMAM